jgi:hypothetical protein
MQGEINGKTRKARHRPGFERVAEPCPHRNVRPRRNALPVYRQTKNLTLTAIYSSKRSQAAI